MIEAVGSALAALTQAQSAPTTSGAAAAPDAGTDTVSFAVTLRSALDRLDGAVASADRLAKASAAGDHDIPLSDVMVSLEQANLAMQMAANVRDKVVAAYTSIMNMPV